MEFYCDNCNKNTTKIKKSFVSVFPQVLIFLLKRYHSVDNKHKSNKLENLIKVNEEIKFYEKGYNCVSLITHLGDDE